MSPPRRYEKPEALASIRTDRHGVIEAAAGTGKTYVLEHLIIELLLARELPIERILVVTFTEKATAELIDRVRRKLEEILGDRWPSAPAGAPAWAIDEKARLLLERALFAFDTASISTIHAFCQRVLTEHAFAHRRLFEQTAIDEESAFSSAFREVLRGELARDPELRPYLRAWLQRRTIKELEQLLLACWRARGALQPAFDGAALARAIASFSPVDEALARALSRQVGRGGRKLVEGLAKIAALRERFLSDGDPAQLLVHLDEARVGGLRDALASLESPDGAVAGLLSQVGGIARSVVGLEAAVAQLFLDRVSARARERKSAAGQFDFQDMLSLVQESLEGARGELLAAALRRRYGAALIDEFQDTDDVQWTIFRRIFAVGAAGQAPESTLFVIGDPKQAIYGFRGADVHTYFGAVEQLGEALPLTRNYRSTPLLIEAYNEVLSEDDGAPLFDGRIRYRHPVTPGRPDLCAVDAAGGAVTPVHLLCPVSAEGRLRAPQVKRTLARRIAAEIRKLLDRERPPLRFGTAADTKPIEPGDVFVLTRTTQEGYLVGDELRAAGIDHAYYKQDGLFQRPEARHAYELLRAIAAPQDRSQRMRAWLTPFFGLVLRDLDGLTDVAGSDPLLQRLLDWKALADGRDFARLFPRILEESGIVRREVLLHQSERELTNYLHLFEILLEEAGRSHATLDDLVRTLASFIEGTRVPAGEDGGVQRLESERRAVQIMSIHKAKGLEATVVFVFGGFSRTRTSRVHVFHDDRGARIAWVGSPRDEAAQAVEREAREEDQRLLYVAMTRAKARLYLPFFREVEQQGASKEEFRFLNGCYRQLNDRLRRVLSARADPRIGRLFSVEEVAVAPSVEPLEPPIAQLSDWRAADELLVERDEREAYRRERRAHAGFVVTSYSRLKEARGGYHALAAADDDEPPDRGEEGRAAASPDIAGDELPGGRNTGNFLHSLLEEVPLASFGAGAPSTPFALWSELPAVADVIERNAGKYGIDRRHLPHARRLVHAGFTSPVRLGDGRILPGLASAGADLLREMEFLYPIPERDHPRLSDGLGGMPARDRFRIERGFVRGFVDVVFEHRGLVYLADWKSDSLPAWDRSFIDAQVAQNYRLQAQLYAIALVKMLGVRDEARYRERFGGLLYCFLRGVRPDGRGIEGLHFERPAWSEILAWEEELLREDLLPAEPEGEMGR